MNLDLRAKFPTRGQAGFLLGLFLLLMISAPSLLIAQTTTQSQPASQPSPSSQPMNPVTTTTRAARLTVEALQNRIKQAELITDEATRKKVTDTYQEALDTLHQADALLERMDQLKDEREAAPAQIDDIKSKLAAPIETPSPKVPEKATLSQLQQIQTQIQADLDANEKLKGNLETKLKVLIDRRLKLPDIAAQAKQKLDDARKNLKMPQAMDNPNDPVQAAWILTLAHAKLCHSESQLYDEELLGFDIRLTLLRSQIDLANRDLLVNQKKITAWQEVVNNFRREEADRITSEARREAVRAHRAVRKLAEENAALAERISGPDGLAAMIENVTNKNDEIEQQLTKLKDRFKNIQTTVDKAGVTDAISLLLRKERSNLPKVRQYKKNRKDIETKMADAHFQLILVEEERSDLTDIDAQVKDILKSLSSWDKKHDENTVRQAAKDALLAKKTYLTNLINNYDTYIEKMAALDTNIKDLVSETTAFQSYIDEHVLWFQSTAPFGQTYLAKSWDAVLWLVHPAAWHDLLKNLWADFIPNAGQIGFLFLFSLALIILSPLFYNRLQRTSGAAEEGKEESHWRTFEAVMYTLLLASGWPLLLWLIGWRIEISDRLSEFARAISAGFVGMAMILFTLNLVMKTCLPQGLADKHFRWDMKNLNIIRSNISWLILIALPTLFLTLAMEVQDNEFRTDSLGRLAFMVLMSAFGLCLWKIAGPMKGTVRLPSNWLGRLKYFWYPLFIIPPILVVIAALGFYYTATELGWKMLATLWLLLLLMFIQEMMLRWLYLAQRRLAIDKTETAQADDTDKPKRFNPLQKAREAELNIFKISLQNRKLLRSIIGFLMAIGFWLIWADVLPALGILKQIHLWESVTLAGFLLAIIITIMTVIASKNIPGLLEVTLLHRLPLDAGSRFTATTLSRYIITVFGLVIAFDLIGIGWAKIQWLIAAMTVGLGFGLQEIFANFVSGIIILFERPIRVGDVVTVDDVNGIVTRIHIRATTITDWDRKELIVPNKEFITGRVINWTLSDRITRLLIKVGVAYGSDTDLVQKLLLEATKSLPSILSDPAPSAIFTGFGDSSLDFEVRAYIPNVDNQLTMRHELFTAINKKLQTAGIEIPFPQQDLHIRSIDVPISMERKKTS